ncbi:DUF6261 family protein [Carboxylicivirga sp. M1479]|uniref:DUF6261 family protein n=1 Tax=Carboxylicivirga sp. M1479 TaxID=2594476 RepID=UPI001178462A|nr:DUF6261 family protein [Carboxylicivirga sp. M1479]TRX70866.1 hypothetical protein FNN09_09390 [Carboxylicivirga sp. M1479]
MIPKILTTTRVSELNGVTQQLIDKYTKGDYSSDSHLTQLFANLSDTNQQLGIAIMRHTAQSELADLDAITDNEVSQLHGLTKGYTCHPDEAIANAAHMLFQMIDKYGLEVKKKSYREEYPLLGSMLTESKTEPYPASIAQLDGCAERFNMLETAVNNFNTKQNAYLSVKDDEQNLASATDIKKQLICFINEELIAYLNVMQKVQADVYSELAQHTANRISESNNAVRLRRNKVEVNE